MADDSLRLRADVIDRASPALREIKKSLGEVRKTPGMEALGGQLKTLQEGVDGFSKAGALGVGAMNALGLGALTASTSIVGIISRFKELAQQTNTLREMSRETGLTVDQLKQMQMVAGRFGVGADQMTKALQNVYDAQIDLRRGNSQLASELNGQGLGTFVQKLKKDNPTEFLRDMIELLGSDKLMQNPMLQRRWAEAVFGDGGMVVLFQDGAKAVLKAWDEVTAKLDKTPQSAIDNAKKLQGAVGDLNIQIANLENMAEPRIFKYLADGASNSAEVIKATITLLRGLHHLMHAPASIRFGYRKHGLFSPAQSPQEGSDKLADYASERAEIQARLAKGRAQSRDPAMFDTLHQADGDRIQELTNAIQQLTDEMRGGGGGAKPMRFNGSGVNALRQNVAYTASTGFGIGDATPFEQAVERGVFKGLVDFANRGDLASQTPGAGGITSAAYHPGGGMSGQDNTPIGRAFSTGRHPAGGSPLSTAGAGRGGDDPSSVSRARESWNYWKSQGASDKVAAGLLGMEEGENNFLANGGMFKGWGDRGAAYGSFMWHRDRREQIAAGTGINVIGASHLDQLRAAHWEMVHGSRAGLWSRLNRGDMSPYDANRLGVIGFEGPKDIAGNVARRGARAEHWYRQFHQPEAAGLEHQSSLLDAARGAGLLNHRIAFDGGATVRLELAGNTGAVRNVRASANGMVRNIELNRGSSMMPTLDA